MDLGLAGKTAIVTGSSRGIGRAIAAGLAAEGCRVCLCARDPERLEAARLEIGGGAEAFAVPADVTVPADAERLVAETLRVFGRIDILVSNVGGSRGAGSFLDSGEEVFRSAMELNAFSGLKLAKLVVPHMQAQGGGVILFTASIWGREAGGAPSYNMAKAAEISLAKALARELAPFNIRVNSIAPGSVLHPGGSWERRMKADPEGVAEFIAAEIPFGRLGRPEEVANLAVFLASERAGLISGACINIDGCQSRSLI